MSSLDGIKSSLSLDVLIRFSLILMLAIICFQIISPFVVPLVWGLIIAIALKPLHIAVGGWFGGNSKIAATIIALLLVSALLIPSVSVGISTVSGIQEQFTEVTAGNYTLPDLPAAVAGWPLVGESINGVWIKAQANLPATISEYEPQIKTLMSKAGGTAGSLVGGVLQFTFSIIIAAIFWVNGPLLASGAAKLATRLFGADGPEYLLISRQTIQSVAKGVIGVALIQALAAGAGLAFAGVPAAAVWASLVLILAVAQLPPILILGPIAAWLYGQDSSTTATLFLVWSIVVSGSDAVLKPMFLGRGVKVPMVIILIGAIGGMMAVGILGLFVGAVVLGIAYEITVRWVTGHSQGKEDS